MMIRYKETRQARCNDAVAHIFQHQSTGERLAAQWCREPMAIYSYNTHSAMWFHVQTGNTHGMLGSNLGCRSDLCWCCAWSSAPSSYKETR